MGGIQRHGIKPWHHRRLAHQRLRSLKRHQTSAGPSCAQTELSIWNDVGCCKYHAFQPGIAWMLIAKILACVGHTRLQRLHMPGDAVEAEHFWRMRGMLKYFFWTHDAQDFEASCLWLMQIHPSMVRLWFSAKPSVSCCCKAASLHWSAEQKVWDHPGAICSDPALSFWDSSKMLLFCFKLSKQQKPQKNNRSHHKAET